MINGTFDISVDTPKLHRRGTVSLKSQDGAIIALLNVGEDLKGEHFEGTCEDKEFSIVGSGDFPTVGHVDYDAKGSVWGNSLDITIESSIGKITMFGTRIGGAAGADVSSHEFMMKASRAEFDANDSTMYTGSYGDGS